MTLATLGAVLALLQSPLDSARPQGTGPAIEGVVVRAGTSETLANAQVTLIRVASTTDAQATSDDTSSTTQAVTDRSGRFAFRNVEPGSYRIAAARNGYARQEYGQRVFGGLGRVVTIAAGHAVESITVSLIPAGTVTGVVSDPSGEAIAGLQVQLLRQVYGTSGQRSFVTAGSGRTDDRGEYRLFWVTPGRYYLVVHPPAFARAVAILGSPESPNEIAENRFPPTYYPGTIDVSQASLIDVRPGEELHGIDVPMSRQILFRLRGKVVDATTGQPPRTASVTIVSRGPAATPVALFGSASPYDPADGTFELRDIAPGMYWVRATVTTASADSVLTVNAAGRTLADIFTESVMADRRVAQIPADVAGADVDGLVIVVSAATSIRGRLRVEGRTLAAVGSLDGVQVTLRPVTTTGTTSNRHRLMSADGVFRLDNVSPGDYFTTVQPLPPDYYVKAASLDQAEALEQPLVISGAASGTLDVLLSPSAGRVEGTVLDGRGQGVPGVQAVLVPSQRLRWRSDLFRTATTDDNGRFSLIGIPPGDYSLFSWEALESFAYFDEDVLRRFAASGMFVRVAESSTATAQVTIIPAPLP
jgi:protocatechuate 3,4-dioxygenase beta subunit